MNSLYESLNNSQLKKKRLIENDINENRPLSLNEVRIGITYDKINQVKKK